MLGLEARVEGSACPACNSPLTAGATRCAACGTSLVANAPVVGPAEPAATTAQDPERNTAGRNAWLIGAVLGIVVTLLPFVGFAAWFFGALCHEMGHSAMSLATGSPSLPAIRLDGHAVAVSRDPIPFARVLIWAGLIALTWRVRQAGGSWKLWAGLACAYPLIAWPAREVLVLYAGQFGELAFAGVFLWRAWTGGFTESPAERPLYAMLGWMLVVGNLVLAWGLVTDTEARAAYWESGSFGLTNDLIRVAHDHLGTALSTAAIPLLLGSLATPALAWWLGQRWLRR